MVRLSATLTLAVLAAAVFAAPASAAKPKVGQYIGETEKNHQLTLHVTGKRVRVDVDCGLGTPVEAGPAKLRRTRRGYRFELNRRGAPIAMSGHFSRAGTSARGRVTIRSRRCDSTGPVRWTARHVKRPVKAPADGYDGTTGQRRGITLIASGRSIELASFAFRCGYGDGRISLNAVALRRTRKGYAFSVKANGNVTYSDGYPDENAAVSLSGRFNLAATRAAGHIRVNSPRCGDTGRVPFTAKRG